MNMPPTKKSKGSTVDVSDFNIEGALMSEASAIQPIEHEGIDHLADLAHIPQPTKDDLATPEAAQDWTQRELWKATPRAVQETIAQLRYGTKRERMEAANKILDRAGHKGESTKVTNIAPVIVLTSDALSNIPWARKAVVEGKVVQKELPTAERTVVSDKSND
jgi:hypothetical protein